MFCSGRGIKIARSIEEKLPLVTTDAVSERYPIDVIW
jgi:PIN domain nuclease of toxin-antitoxin system